MGSDQFSQMEFNYLLFWGIAIQMYDATLRADDSPFDKATDLGDPLLVANGTVAGWGAQMKQGLAVSQDINPGGGKCIACHAGPELTGASETNVTNEKVELMQMGISEPPPMTLVL